MEATETKLLTLVETARLCPKRTSTNALWRWARRGLRARNGQTLRLEHVRVGGVIMIPAGALDVFFKELADADTAYFDAPVPAPAPSPKPRTGKRTAHDQAVALLAERGL